MLIVVGVSCHFSYSFVNYLYVNCKGSITSVEIELIFLLLFNFTCNHVVSARRGFFSLLVLVTGWIILL